MTEGCWFSVSMDGVSKADEEVAKDEPAAHNWEVAWLPLPNHWC